MALIPQNNPKTTKVVVDDKTAHVIGTAFWRLVHHYQLSREEQAILLGIKNNRARLNDLEKEGKVPVEYDVFFRVGNILGIHKNLRILFPHNRELVYQWMKTAQPLLGGQAPIEYIKSDPVKSTVRLFAVRRLLDQVRCR